MIGLDFQAQFMSGREFGLRVRGEGILLLHRVRAALQALAGEKGPERGQRARAATPSAAAKR